MRLHPLTIAMGAAMLAGCASVPARKPLPSADTAKAELVGLPGVRIVMNPFHFNYSDLDHSLLAPGNEAPRSDGPMTLLALSGGGAHGAWGAGVLNGWTIAGSRPDFDIVTGISTGALSSPYAFLGSPYDDELKESYTAISDDDIFNKRSIYGILRHSDSLADSTPLLESLRERYGKEVLEEIAAEHRKGRRLYVGSTDLDAQVLVAWDMGAIAASGYEQAGEIFCQILLASASIPVAFPPVSFQVEYGGVVYDELHADGGLITQVFGFPLLSRLMEARGCDDGAMYVIRNAYMAPEWVAVKPELTDLASRSIDTLIKMQGLGDVIRAWMVASQAGIDFNVCDIPPSVPEDTSGEPFDPAYMTMLFNAGYAATTRGTVWSKEPPGLKVLEQAEGEQPAGSRHEGR